MGEGDGEFYDKEEEWSCDSYRPKGKAPQPQRKSFENPSDKQKSTQIAIP